MVPITVTAGNVGVAFAALSYAGALTVTVITDPEWCRRRTPSRRTWPPSRRIVEPDQR